MQFIDLKAQYEALKDEIDQQIRSVLDAGQYIGGAPVNELEKKLAAYVGRKHCITCANGTDALQIAYMVYGIGAGDAVFCSDITFISSTEPSKMFGATSVFCDIQPDTYNLCPVSLEKQIQAVLAEGKLTPKAVVAVDILGKISGNEILGLSSLGMYGSQRGYTIINFILCYIIGAEINNIDIKKIKHFITSVNQLYNIVTLKTRDISFDLCKARNCSENIRREQAPALQHCLFTSP